MTKQKRSLMACKQLSQYCHRSVVIVLVCAGLLLNTLGVPSEAQVATNITSTTGAGNLGTIVTPGGTTTTITGGTRPGNGTNLFHSFGQFSIAAPDTANFLNETGRSTTNILSRVTGGNPSNIFGTIQTTGFANANLFLMNPAGIVFGPNATLNVGGSVHFTTADHLRLADLTGTNAGIFHANTALASVLTTAPVAAFGFLNPNPGPITVQGAVLSVPAGQTISLVGGNITIQAGVLEDGTVQASRLSAPNGQINLASTASPGEFLVQSLLPNPNVNGDSFSSFGSISLARGSSVAVSGNGIIAIRGGQFVLEIENSSLSTADGPDPPDSVTLNNGSSIVTAAFGIEPAADVEITVGNLAMDGASIIKTASSGDGGGGNVTANVNTLTLMGGSGFISDNSGNGPGGNLTVQGLAGSGTMADSVVISGVPSGIFTFNNSGGNGGGVMVAARSLSMDAGGEIRTQMTGLLGDGPGGDIVVNVQVLNLLNGASIKTETSSFQIFGIGQGGNVTVTATDSAVFSGPGSGLFSDSDFGGAPPGEITVNAKSFTLTDSAVIQSGSPFNISGGGKVTVQGTGGPGSLADSVAISNGGSISNQALATDAGSVSIFAQDLTLDNGSINTSTLNAGRGGDIVLNVGSVSLLNRAVLSSQSSDIGNAGDISITASDSIVSRDSTMTTTANLSDGGNINLKAGNLIHLTNTTVSSSVGNPQISTTVGGNIFIDPQFFILENSRILANAFAGTGGNINITAGVFLVDPLSIIDASSALGVSGTITIQSPISELSGTLAPLPQGFLRTGTLLSSRCDARLGGPASSLVVAGRDAIPMEPGGLLPSPLYSFEASGALANNDERASTPNLHVGTDRLVALNLVALDGSVDCAP